MHNIHYFFDPMCGWCYAASPLLQKLAQSDQFDIHYYPGGMIPKRAIDPGFRQHIVQADQRIASLSKVEFGKKYQQRVTANGEFILDSYLTTQAFWAGQTLGINAHDMLQHLQQAHYIEGMPLHQEDHLQAFAAQLGIEESTWQAAMQQVKKDSLKNIQDNQQRMSTWQVSGFPTLFLQQKDRLIRLQHSQYYGQPDAFMAHLTAQLDHQ
ncbi:DsbA family protein [Marinomonas sp. THO17]|uniref:DsbA family protein n=1 Tax=Marinomonas sp. THO17 TaxID=3149048 RepID=UPI00336BDB0F